jgi:hypothetical protein
MTKEELQKMLDELPQKKYGKLSDKQLEANEYTRNLNIETGLYYKNGKSALGKKRTKEQSLNLSKQRKGRKISDEGKKNISIGAKNRKEPSKLKGKKRTEEEKKKMSENRKGKGLGKIMNDKHKETLRNLLKIKFKCPHCNKEIGGKANYLKHIKIKH